MSPRLLFVMTNHRFERDRDRIDARLAATRMGVRQPVSLHAVPDSPDLLGVAA